jgi:hypothetical protein
MRCSPCFQKRFIKTLLKKYKNIAKEISLLYLRGKL